MRAEFVDIGNINHVYKLEAEGNTYFMKHYGKVRRETEGMKAIGDLGDRCKRECDAIRFYRHNLNSKHFPEIVSEEKDLAVFTSVGDVSLQDMLLSGNYDKVQIHFYQQALAVMLQDLHSHIIDFNDKELDERFYKFRTASNKEAMDLYKPEDFRAINGDLNPRQIFPKDDGFGICDFEFTGMGLPGYDVGFYLANLHIMNYIKGGLDDVIEDFQYRPEHTDFFIGTSILNRVQGAPLASYIPSKKVFGLIGLANTFIHGGKNGSS